jgi:hypothetical protein
MNFTLTLTRIWRVQHKHLSSNRWRSYRPGPWNPHFATEEEARTYAFARTLQYPGDIYRVVTEQTLKGPTHRYQLEELNPKPPLEISLEETP